MHDKGKVIAGIVIFLIVVLFPIWFTGAFGDFKMPEPDPATDATRTECVRNNEDGWMTANHMDLLNEWRDDVVRREDRGPVLIAGEEWEKSLTRTCLGCHGSYQNFCNECHTYADVKPDCWQCHVIPEGK
jgi:[DsrC]-trisulfide reductase subunit J